MRKQTTDNVISIGIKDAFLYENGAQLKWADGQTVNIKVNKSPAGIYATLFNVTTNVIQSVRIEAVQSNLGKGQLYYFVCSNTAVKCKRLYLIDGQSKFKSRAALGRSLYYPLQVCSKKDRANKQYFAIKSKLNALNEKRKANTYKGRVTKRLITHTKRTAQLNAANVKRTMQLAKNINILTGGRVDIAV